MRDRLKRFALKSKRGLHPKRVDWIGKEQNLNASLGEALKMRAGSNGIQIVAESIVDCGLVLFHRGGIVGKTSPRVLGGRAPESSDSEQRVTTVGILVEALFDHRPKRLPELQIGLGIILR